MPVYTQLYVHSYIKHEGEWARKLLYDESILKQQLADTGALLDM